MFISIVEYMDWCSNNDAKILRHEQFYVCLNHYFFFNNGAQLVDSDFNQRETRDVFCWADLAGGNIEASHKMRFCSSVAFSAKATFAVY